MPTDRTDYAQALRAEANAFSRITRILYSFDPATRARIVAQLVAAYTDEPSTEAPR